MSILSTKPGRLYIKASPSSDRVTEKSSATPVASMPLAGRSLVVALIFGAIACADSPMGTVSPVRTSSALRDTPANAQMLAKGLALAMVDPSIRGQVHAALRGSTFNEHKLVFQDFVNTAAGERVLRAVSNALGQTVSSTKSQVASLPALDFYLPFETHRQTWKSSSDVYVATTFEKRAPSVTAYGTNGQVLELRQADGVPTVPLIILHPAEPKIHTVPGNSPLDLIESPPTTARTSVPQHNLIYCGDTCGGGGGSCCSTSSPPGTYITHFNIQASDGWFGDSEMRFQSWALAGHIVFLNLGYQHTALVSDYQCDKGLYSQDGVKQYLGYYGPYMISPSVYKGSFLTCNGYPAVYAVHIMEIDGDIGSNDDYGWRIWAPGQYPWGATYDVVYTYYGNTYPAENANTTAYFRITIQ
ncbi:MAG TPA: hypothetical protein VHL12_00080 [Gemmatimonadaceae bacterium]|nr:hypothetical protein [Gemmatimonadaceae bacterium]